MAGSVNADRGRAARYLGTINLTIIKGAAMARQGYDGRPGALGGDRAPVSLAARPVALRVLTEAVQSPGDKPAVNLITPLGYATAVRSLPRVLSVLGDADPRRRAALTLADAVERIGSIKGADWGGTDSSAGNSDGGVTTKIKHATRLRRIEALANGWEITRTGKINSGDDRVAMPITRRRGNRQEIKAFAALLAICVDGLSLDEILRRYGWSAQTVNRKALGDAVLAVLDDVADGLGMGRWTRETS